MVRPMPVRPKRDEPQFQQPTSHFRSVILLEPDAPMIDLLEVTATLALPEILPFTTMTAAPLAPAAEEN